MADRIEAFSPTIPAGTLQSAPVRLAMTFPDGILRKVTITVPPGPGGLVGFQIAQSGQPVIPRTPGRFIIADNRVIPWEIANYPSGGSYSMIGYNTDLYDHTLYVEFELDELTSAAHAPVTILPIG